MMKFIKIFYCENKKNHKHKKDRNSYGNPTGYICYLCGFSWGTGYDKKP